LRDGTVRLKRKLARLPGASLAFMATEMHGGLCLPGRRRTGPEIGMGTGVFWALYTCSGLHSALHAIPVASLSREIQTPEHSTWLDACLVDRWRNSLAFLGTVSRSQKHPLAGTGTKAVLLFPAAGIALFRSHTNEQLRHRIRGDLAHGQAYPTTRARHTVLTPGSRAVSREARRNATAAAAAAVVSWLGMLNSMLAWARCRPQGWVRERDVMASHEARPAVVVSVQVQWTTRWFGEGPSPPCLIDGV
jgi:hypothetical protein